MNKVLFPNKYEDLYFILPDTGHMYCIREEDIVFGRRYGLVVHVVDMSAKCW